MDASDRKLIGDIERYGRHVVTVSSAAGEQGEPPFAYPVGLQKSLGWAELLCHGLADGKLIL